jgi:hypothetical protein
MKPTRSIHPFSDGLHHVEILNEWDPVLARTTINKLFESAIFIVDDKIRWYRRSKAERGKWARRLRIVAIFFLIASTMMPYIASINPDTSIKLLYFGYILAGAGAGILLLDRYYGYSNSWIRFALTSIDLESMRNTFVEQWQILYIRSLPLTKDSFCTLADAITKFRESFKSTVKAETEAWAREFQQNFNELIAALKKQSDQLETSLQEKKQEAAEIEKVQKQRQATGEIPEEIFEQAKNEKAEEWKKTYNLIGVGHGRKQKDGDPQDIHCIIMYPVDKLDQSAGGFNPVPAFISYSSDGVIYQLPTDVVPLHNRMTAIADPALLCDAFAVKRPGCSVARHANNKGTGTVGLKVYRDSIAYILSCYHVFCYPEFKNNTFEFNPESASGAPLLVSPSLRDETDPQKRKDLATVTEGILNNQMDGAIALLNENTPFTDKICSIDKRPGSVLKIEKKHADAHHAIVSVGRTSGILYGSIQDHSLNIDVDYEVEGEIKTFKFEKVILANQRAKGGDSGAAVLDGSNNVIGIIAATTGSQTCIIPISRLLEKFSITLKPSAL